MASKLLLPAVGWVWLFSLTLAGLLGFDVRRHHFEAAGIALGVGFAAFVALHRPAMPSPPVRRLNGGARAVYLLPMAVAVIAFGWSVGLGPLSDDFVLHRWASSGDLTPDGWPYLRPLPLALWQAIMAFGGDWGAFHAISVLLHAINSALVASLSASWVGPRAGVAAGLVFAIFPASAEAVAWTAGIFDVVATMFVLLAAVVWTRVPPSPRRTLSLVLFSVAGFLSKESAIVIPAILASIAALTLPATRSELRQNARAWGLIVLTVVTLLAIRTLWFAALAGHLDNLPIDRRQWKDLIVRPFAALAVPMRTESGATAETYVVGLAVLMMIGAALVQVSTRRPAADRPAAAGSRQLVALAVGAGWVLLGSLPLLTQFYVSPTLEGSRYLYLPTAGFAVALSAGVASSMRRALVPGLGLLALLGLYSAALNTERDVWGQAASTRDALLEQAASTVRAVPCRTLDVLEAPDNVRGAFVFRQGLTDALSRLPYDPNGMPCIVRWNGSTLVPDLAEENRIPSPRVRN